MIGIDPLHGRATPDELVLLYLINRLYYGRLRQMCCMFLLLVFHYFHYLLPFLPLQRLLCLWFGSLTMLGEWISGVLEEIVLVSFPILHLFAHMFIQHELLLNQFLFGLGENGMIDHIVIVEFLELVHGNATGRVKLGLVVRYLQAVVAE